jgi:hypothetical protein
MQLWLGVWLDVCRLGIALPCSNELRYRFFANAIYHFRQIAFKTRSTGTLQRTIAGRSNTRGKPALAGRTS